MMEGQNFCKAVKDEITPLLMNMQEEDNTACFSAWKWEFALISKFGTAPLVAIKIIEWKIRFFLAKHMKNNFEYLF